MRKIEQPLTKKFWNFFFVMWLIASEFFQGGGGTVNKGTSTVYQKHKFPRNRKVVYGS